MKRVLALILSCALLPCVSGADEQTSSNSIQIAVVQQESNPGKPEQNRNKALRFAAEALGKGADIVLFHEEMLLGCVENPLESAEPMDGPTTRAFQRLLQGRRSLIIYGLTEKDGDKCFISATVVSEHGVVANYHKTHLFWMAKGARYEPALYRPGDRLVTFDFSGYRCGLMICYDGDFPEMTRAYANRGCQLLFWLNNRPSRGYEEVKMLALQNSMIMATACCCGRDESGRLCPGGSNITDATGKLLAEIWDHEGVILADVSPGSVPQLRLQNPLYRGQRPELYR